jgi:hypothetical protein
MLALVITFVSFNEGISSVSLRLAIVGSIMHMILLCDTTSIMDGIILLYHNLIMFIDM